MGHAAIVDGQLAQRTAVGCGRHLRLRAVAGWQISAVFHLAAAVLCACAVTIVHDGDAPAPQPLLIAVAPMLPVMTTAKEEARVPVVNALDLIETDVDEAGAIAGDMAGPRASALDTASMNALVGDMLSTAGAGTGAEGRPDEDQRQAHTGTGARQRDDTGIGDGFAVGNGEDNVGGIHSRGITCYCKARRQVLLREGGTWRSENAVESALRWFKRHQSEDGRWAAVGYAANCQATPKCEPGSLDGTGGSEVDIALTGYAVLCYLGAGFDHFTPSRFTSPVRRGLEFLVASQQPDGLLGKRTYEHAVAAYALAEAFAHTGDPTLRGPAQLAIAVILQRQARGGGGEAQGRLGWDYEDGHAERNDASVSGWCVLALRAAAAGGLDVGTGLGGARAWLERAWQAANPGWAQLDAHRGRSSFPYVWDASSGAVLSDPPGSPAHDLAPVGALCAAFLRHPAGDPMLETLCNHIEAWQLPMTYPCNTYYLYYDTAAVFQAGGERWKRWNAAVRDLLVGAQRGGTDCFTGSWDAHGTVFPGHEVGRVLSTAYCCLCLEVYYRQERVAVEPAVGRCVSR